MMAGLPIICAFDAPETLVETYHCGFQCSPENTDECVRAIRQLNAMSPEERRAMGESGRKAILERFTYPVLARQFLEVME